MVMSLLAIESTLMWVVLGAAGTLALVSVIYGLCKKFVQMSWTSWQILVVFALSLLLPYIPMPEDSRIALSIGAGYLVVSVVLVLAAGAGIRRAMINKKTRSNLFIRFCNRFLGAVTAVLNFVVIALVLGGFALGILQPFSVWPELDVVYSHPIWTEFAAGHVRDLMLITCCLFFVRGGYRIGVARSLQTIFTVLFTLVALVGSLYLCISQPPLRSFVNAIAASMSWSGLNIVITTLIGFFVAVFLLFLVFFAVILLLGFFFNKLIRKYRSVRVLGALDGILLSIIFTAVFVGLQCGVNLLLSMCIDGSLIEMIVSRIPADYAGSLNEMAESIASYAEIIASFYTSSPLGKIFYENNPLLFLPSGM